MPPAVPSRRVGLDEASRQVAARSPVMAGLHAQHGPYRPGRPERAGERFEGLANAIVYQQLAGSAASVIWGRVRALVDGPFTPESVAALGVDELRAAGLSGAKARSVHDLAAHVADGRVRLDRIGRRPDEAVVAELTQVWGIGTWTAQMFLMFSLRRLDVWPTGDLGVRAGWARAHGLEVLPEPAELEPLGELFRPYRSVAAWYCWRAVETKLL